MAHNVTWMGVAKKMVTDFMILLIQKFSASFTRTEALKMHKYLHPGYLLWVATDPPLILASKELHIILSRSLSGRLPGSLKDPIQLNATMAMHDVVHTRYVTLFCCVNVTSSHHDAWRMERDSFDQTMT
jgi:hypothetical protein